MGSLFCFTEARKASNYITRIFSRRLYISLACLNTTNLLSPKNAVVVDKTKSLSLPSGQHRQSVPYTQCAMGSHRLSRIDYFTNHFAFENNNRPGVAGMIHSLVVGITQRPCFFLAAT